MDFIKGFFNDGYSEFFIILFFLSFLPLLIDIKKNGWIIKEVEEVNQ